MYDRWIEGAGRFPGGALGRKDGPVRSALPRAEREMVSLRGEGEGGGEKNEREDEFWFHEVFSRATGRWSHKSRSQASLWLQSEKMERFNAEDAENAEVAEKHMGRAE